MDWPTTLGIVALALVVFAVLARLHYVFWVSRLTVPAEYSERHDLVTDDDVPITLYRLEPPPTPSEPPVLVVHGLAANHRNVDAEPDRSVSRYLHAQGRDVWLLTLRSGNPALNAKQRAKVDFRSMVENDIPEAIAFVRDRTHAERIDYVGFSMGGMLLYAALGRTVAPEVLRRVAMIGSPARVAPPILMLRRLRFLPRFVFRGLWLRLGARMAAFLIEHLRTPIHRFIYNPDNVKRGATGRALVNLIEDVQAPLSADFAAWALADGVVRIEGRDIVEQLPSIEIPAIFFAGAADRIARAKAVRVAYENWGRDAEGIEKRFVLMGTEGGCRYDYGHGDLAIGDHLAEELFPPLGAFLACD
jgi:pimeloyl-ACP methyl ester carboxylesterase